jgi:nitrogen regulatory protein PII
MDTHVRKLVTIVTEASLEQELLEQLDKLGARGYTVTEARGRGDRGRRAAGWSHGANIRVEVICEATLAGEIAHRLRERFYAHYAMIIFLHDVEVMRPEKF